MLYKDQKCRIINSNFLRTFFHFKKGDSSSSTIVGLYVKYLAIMLRQNTQYRSLKICTELINVLLLADDAVEYLNDSPFN